MGQVIGPSNKRLALRQTARVLRMLVKERLAAYMIILTGVAGAGKSMQGKILADEHGYAWISTGEIFACACDWQAPPRDA